MMKFLRIQCKGSVNSFRRPDFYTYHKTLPLPPKTTIAGLLGSALGISPFEVNQEWIKSERFRMGIVGKHNGTADDLWQIRKYESKQIDSYKKGNADAPYKTAVIVRELLFGSEFTIYLNFNEADDFTLIENAITNPKWAVSLGREDELIKIDRIDVLDLSQSENLQYSNTVLPGNINEKNFEVLVELANSGNLMTQAPTIVKLPIEFEYDEETEVRIPSKFKEFSFIHDLPIKMEDSGYYDEELKIAFQIF